MEVYVRKIRVLIAKPGLDGHDRGAKFVARALQEKGYEVVYTGIRQTPKQIALSAVQEDVDFVGLSLLSGAHNELFPKVKEELNALGASDIVVFGGGVIPQSDYDFLKSKDIKAIFGPGTPIKTIIDFIENEAKSRNIKIS